MTVFTQRRIRAAFAAIAARASRLRILVVRRSLPGKPNSRWASETHNEETLEEAPRTIAGFGDSALAERSTPSGPGQAGLTSVDTDVSAALAVSPSRPS